MNDYLAWQLIIPSFLMVFFKAMQQQNVIHRNFCAVPIVTYGIGACDVFLSVGVVDYGVSFSTVNGLAIGGALGCLSAMFVHGKFFRGKK